MSRDTTLTKRDADFMRIRDEILKCVKGPRVWKRFKEYMDSYYETQKSHLDVIKEEHGK